MKVGPGRVKAEHDDARKVAERTGRPLREVLSLAESTWQAEHGDHERVPTTEGDTGDGEDVVTQFRHVHEHDHDDPLDEDPA